MKQSAGVVDHVHTDSKLSLYCNDDVGSNSSQRTMISSATVKSTGTAVMMTATTARCRERRCEWSQQSASVVEDNLHYNNTHIVKCYCVCIDCVYSTILTYNNPKYNNESLPTHAVKYTCNVSTNVFDLIRIFYASL